MLIAELQPKAIIELGSGSGASAVWLADVADAHGLNPQIISIDHRCVDVADPRVTFRTGDIADLKTLLDPYTASMQHPWLVIEDAHVHIAEVLSYFDEHLRSGDYMIIEDSAPKRGELRQFASAARGRYCLDTLYLDLFGQNTTCAIDSILRRM
jgi:cephalosporin hydroxylase